MAKFSVGGDDDGEGPSNPTQKRRRITVCCGTVGEDAREDIGDTSGTEHQPDDLEQEVEVVPSEEHDADDEDPFGFDSLILVRSKSNDSGGKNTVSSTQNRDRSISLTLTDPDVLDCCICYEPLTIPTFQVGLKILLLVVYIMNGLTMAAICNSSLIGNPELMALL